MVLPRSSSGLGHRPFKAEITGSNPVRGTSRTTQIGSCHRATAGASLPVALDRLCKLLGAVIFDLPARRTAGLDAVDHKYNRQRTSADSRASRTHALATSVHRGRVDGDTSQSRYN